MADLVLKLADRHFNFWQKLKGKNELDDMIGQFIGVTFYRSDSKKRKKMVQRLERQIFAHYKNKYVAEAIDMGTRTAEIFIERMENRGITGGLLNKEVRKAILKRHNLTINQQIQAFKFAMRRESTHKLAEVESFFLEGGALNRTKKDMVKQLNDIHDREQQAIKKARAKGKSPRSVTSFAARFNVAVKGLARDSFRRVAQQASFNAYQREGFGSNGWVWITLNGPGACPDCTPRHGVLGTESFWSAEGFPGDGTTVCGASCVCELVPAEYVQGNKTLVNPLQYKKPVNQTATDIKQFNKRRIDVDTVETDIVPDTHTAKQPGAPK
jgi:hypothetical protein